MPAAAVIATVAVSAYQANKQAKAAKSAANAQARSADQASQVQLDMFNQARSDNEPFRQAGLTGLQEYMALLGLPTSTVTQSAQQSSMPTEWFGAGAVPSANPQLYASDPAYRKAWDEVSAYHKGKFDKTSDFGALEGHLRQVYQANTPQAAATSSVPGTSLTQSQAFDRFRSAPGYQFGLTEGQRTLDSSAAAAGGLFSGKAAKALTKFGQDYADQQGYRPYMNSLASLAGIGQTATSQNNQYGLATANNVGQNMMNAGAARASGINGSADAWGGFANGLTGLAGLYAGRNGNNWGWGGV